MQHNVVFIQGFVAKCFNDQELATFCETHYSEVVLDFGSEMSRRTKAGLLVNHCQRRGEIPALLEKLKAERPKPYEEAKAQLEQEQGGSSLNEKYFTAADQLQDVLTSGQQPELVHISSQGETKSVVRADHPLSESAAEIKKWFLHELSVDEQVFLAAAALFPMLERRELMELYREMLERLHERQAQAIEEA